MRKPLQWHPAFQAVLQIEFAEEAEHLQFYKEYNLTDSPLRIDTLIIKVDQGIQIRKKIGRIFRQQFFQSDGLWRDPSVQHQKSLLFPLQVLVQNQLNQEVFLLLGGQVIRPARFLT